MKQGIVIGTAAKRWDILEECLNSLDGYYKYPIYVAIDNVGDDLNLDTMRAWSLAQNYNVFLNYVNGFEVGLIDLMRHTDLDEFFFLHDTCLVKNKEIFDFVFQTYQGVSVSYGPYFSGYIGKYRTEILRSMTFPSVRSKEDAVQQEFEFTRAYTKLDERTLVADPNFRDDYENNKLIEKFGRKNLVLVGTHIDKYKGTWGPWVGDVPK